MLVQNKHLTTIWYEENTDKIKIIDQRLIPFELKIIELNTVDDVCFAIKEMQVRGAPLIGVTAAYGMYIAAREKIDLKNASEKINATRPTAINLSWALNKIINSGYSILNLVTYFTAGPEEARAWTIKVDTLAPDAAGKIHTDFKKGFIRAETVSYNDFVECNGESKARELGKLRSEGKEYKVQDGDVMHFLFNN